MDLVRFVLIDRLTQLERGQRAVAVKIFSADEGLFEDHFPGFPVVPGSLLIEAMAQTAGWLIAYSLDFREWPVLAMVGQSKFRRFVSPGEELNIEAGILSSRPGSQEASATVSVARGRVAEARLFFHSQTELGGAGGCTPSLDSWRRATFQELTEGRFSRDDG